MVPGKAAAPYSVLVRYEAPYRFEVPFTVTITQRGQEVFTKIYGQSDNSVTPHPPYREYCARALMGCFVPLRQPTNALSEQFLLPPPSADARSRSPGDVIAFCRPPDQLESVGDGVCAVEGQPVQSRANDRVRVALGCNREHGVGGRQHHRYFVTRTSCCYLDSGA